MTCPRPGRVLRNLVVLALATPTACAIENPGFLFDTNTTGAGASTTTDPTSTTADATTDRPTSTTVSTLPSETSSTSLPVDSTTDATSMPGMTTGSDPSDDTTAGVACVPMMEEFKAEADAFFIAGGTGEGQTCFYPDPLIGSGLPCRDLNFGTTVALRLLRSSLVYEGMYAVRFAKADLAGLASKVETATAELVLTMYDDSQEEVTLRIGKIDGPWAEGVHNGELADGGDSSFSEREHGFAANPWSDANDGPRGPSTEVAKLLVPAVFVDHEQFSSGPFDIDDWLAAPDAAQSLVVSFFKDDAKTTKGPGIKGNDFPEPTFKPFLRVYYCLPQP